MLKGRDVSLRSAASAPAPNAGSTLIEALVAVKVFEVEEKKPEARLTSRLLNTAIRQDSGHGDL